MKGDQLVLDFYQTLARFEDCNNQLSKQDTNRFKGQLAFVGWGYSPTR